MGLMTVAHGAFMLHVEHSHLVGGTRPAWPLQEVNPAVSLMRESYCEGDEYGPHFDHPRLVETRVSHKDCPRPVSHGRPSTCVLRPFVHMPQTNVSTFHPRLRIPPAFWNLKSPGSLRLCTAPLGATAATERESSTVCLACFTLLCVKAKELTAATAAALALPMVSDYHLHTDGGAGFSLDMLP
jgi:hypothetical protein